jgi:glucuronate isomerase
MLHSSPSSSNAPGAPPPDVSHEPLSLDPDRYFDPESGVRRIARELYEGTRELPLVCPHGHVDPGMLAADAPFPEPTALLFTPDHYLVRMLYSQGIPLEQMGIPARDGTPGEQDPRKVWQLFGAHFHLFRGTPSGAWLSHELHDLFGVRRKLSAATAAHIYDQVLERLQGPEFRPLALLDRFNIEVLATTDQPGDSLEHHRAIARQAVRTRVIPTFRFDATMQLAAPGWPEALASLEQACGRPIGSYAAFIAAIEERRGWFQSHGATATDHAVVEPLTASLVPGDAERLFAKALVGKTDAGDQHLFEAHMLMELARMSTEDGLVMQLHPGALRNHNRVVAERFGADRGADIPVATEYTRNLRALLNRYGNVPGFRLVVFTLDESTYARELAPLAGHYPALRLGPPWWFHDSIEGMRRFRARTTETAGIYNTAGFNDDTRAFCSIPARHDLSRRVDANFLAGLVARHIVDVADARAMARALAYDLARETYRFDRLPPATSPELPA